MYPGIFWAFPDTLRARAFSFPSMGGAEPNSDLVKPEKNWGELKGVSHVGKCPNTRCSDYAVLNGRNPGGVRDCVFIIRP